MSRIFARIAGRLPRTTRRALLARPLGLEAFEDRTVPAMTLTSAGLQLGFSLTTFASGFPNSGVNSTGPIGLAYPSDGGVLVGDVANNLIYRFPTDADNQTATGPGVTTQNPAGQPLGMATVASGNYVAINGTIARLNNDGTRDASYTPISLSGALAVGGDLANGHLWVSGSGGLYDVDPVAHTATLQIAGGFDGVTVSPDGKTVYAATGGAGAVIDGFDATSHAMVFQTAIPFVDGSWLGTGATAGFIFGNTNDGNIWMVNLTTNQQTLIANGGSRGDFASDDPHNGTVLLTQTDSVLRLIASAASSPKPAVSSLSPAALTEHTGTVLTVNGTGFTPSSVVRLNGTDLATTYVTGNQLTAFVPAGLIPEEGTAGLSVFNPGFGGGPSGAVNVPVTDPAVVGVGATPAAVTTLFNTGVDGTGTPLAGGAADSHYSLIVNPSGPAPTPATVVTNPGVLGWSPGNGPSSDWISYDASGAAGAAATYTYQTTFDLSGFVASTASLSFIVENDNTIPDVRLNGASTGITVGDSFSGFSGPFTISGGFVPGVNVLQFDVSNGGGPTGFRMEVTSFTASPATAVAPVALTAVEEQDSGTLTLATFADPAGLPAVSLTGSNVTGSLQFNGGGSNYFSPSNGFVPAAGFENSSTAFNSTTVPVASGPVEFGFNDGANLISADFDGATLVLQDVASLSGVASETFVFTDPAFSGLTLTKTGDTFPGSGLTASLVGTTLTVTFGGTGSNGTYTGTFSLARVASASDYGAAVNWGDGSAPTAGTIVDNGNGTFSVQGSHTYEHETGLNPLGAVVTITHDSAPPVAVTDTVVVGDPGVVATGGLTLTATEGQSTGLVKLATFTDPGGAEAVGNYSASIDWGDGTGADGASVQLVDNGDGSFSVFGSHTYAEESGAVPNSTPYTVTVTVRHGAAVPLVNAGFEQPVGFGQYATIPGWTLESGTGGGAIEIGGNNIGTPFEGNQFVELNAFAPGTIYQDVPTIPGQTYQLSFAFSARPGTNNADNDVQVSFGGVPVTTVTADGSALGDTAWTVYTFSVVATGTTSRIEFASLSPAGDGVGGLIDAVKLSTNAVVTDDMTVADPAVVADAADPIAPVEGASTGSVLLATFTDPGGAEAVGNYSADIDWGDGMGSIIGDGVITLNGATFEVRGTHTYAEESGATPFMITVTVNHLMTPSQVVTTTAAVSDPQISSLFLASPGFTAQEGASIGGPFTGVATFTDPAGQGVETAADFTATIGWGDGTSDPATVVSDGNGNYHVNIPDHTYAEEGVFTLTVTVTHDLLPPVTSNGVSLTVADTSVSGTGGIALTAVEGRDTGLVQVATFTDPGGAEPLGEYGASVDWGDATGIDFATPRVVAVGGGLFAVYASHTYADESGVAPLTVTVTITHGTSTPTVVADTAAVSDPAVQARGAGPVSAVEGAPAGPVLLATFTDPGGPEPLTSYSVDIDWGDGTPLDPGASIAMVGGVFEVRGTHTYADESGAVPYTVTVTVHHAAAPDATATTTAAVSDPAVVATGGLTLTAVEGQGSAPQVVATFTDPGGAEAVGNYSATIDWGDGSAASPGAISSAAGTFSVTAPTHTYADEGTFTLTVHIGHDATPVQTVTSTATVGEGDVLAGTAPNLRVVLGETFSGPVATFTNTGYPGNPAADFAATIDWGDGTPPGAGAVSGAGAGKYVVSGAHTYATAGQFTLTVTLADDAPGTAAAAATATATATATTLVVPRLVAVGAVAGGSEVRLVDVSTGAAYRTFVPYGPDFTGGIAVALGDVTGDGFPDLVTAAGHGGAGHVKVFDGLTGAEIRSFFAYDPTFRDGAYVAAGDVDGDGRADIITGAGFGGAPHVKVFSGRDSSLLASFFAYDQTFRNGVRVAAGDVTGDGRADVITGAGPGGGPHVKVFDAAHGLATVQSFFAYAASFSGGVYVGAGDLDGDGRADVITGAGSGGSGHVRAFSGQTGAQLSSFFAFSPNTRDGVTVAGGDPDQTGRDRVVVGLGAGSPAEVKLFDTANGTEEDVFSSLDAGFLDGVYVG